jgi:hypothetical protein
VESGSVNKAAQTLGRMGRGKPKSYSAEELAKRTERLIAGRRAYAVRQREQRDQTKQTTNQKQNEQ